MEHKVGVGGKILPKAKRQKLDIKKIVDNPLWGEVAEGAGKVWGVITERFGRGLQEGREIGRRKWP